MIPESQVNAVHIPSQPSGSGAFSRFSGRCALGLLCLTMIWAPFPDGSNREWAWSVLAILVGLSWLLWLPAALRQREQVLSAWHGLKVPALLFYLVLFWAFLQSQTWTPAFLHNPAWAVLGENHIRGEGAISLAPYRTGTEILKLLTSLAGGALAFFLAKNANDARYLLRIVVLTGSIQALYGLALSLFGTSQLQLMTGIRSQYGAIISGGFINKNNFATFAGLAFLSALVCSGDRIISWARLNQTNRPAPMERLKSVVFSGGLFPFAAFILFCSVLLTGSRGGTAAALGGALILACIGVLYAVRHARRKLSLVLGVLFLLLLIAAMLIAGQFLMQRLLPLLNSEDNSLVAHLIVWKAALRIIFGNPFMGIGLGAFQDAYNLYADTTLPFVIDKAHNDFLEFAAGVGLPAALLWWSSCLLIAGRCLFGAIRRHKNRIYPAAAAAAAILMAIHASVDFPLQIPAVSLMFSVIMGVGYAQAFSSRVRDGAMSRS